MNFISISLYFSFINRAALVQVLIQEGFNIDIFVLFQLDGKEEGKDKPTEEPDFFEETHDLGQEIEEEHNHQS